MNMQSCCNIMFRQIILVLLTACNIFAIASSFPNSTLPSKTSIGVNTTARYTRTTPPPSFNSENACGACGAGLLKISTWQWSQWIFPHTVGKVFVVIDEANNVTRTSTSLETVAITAGKETLSATDWIKNGTFSLGSRRTATMTHVIDGSTTLAYPSRLVRIDSAQLTWNGQIEMLQGNSTQCLDAKTIGSFTMTTALPSLAPQDLDPQDTLGEYYSAIDWKGEHILGPDEVGTYFGPTASAVYSSCTGEGVLPASWATSALFLLETSTQRINAQVKATSSLAAPIPTNSIPAPVQPNEASTTAQPLETGSGVNEATVLVSATAANSMVTSHITISFTHPGTVASWAEAAQNLLSTHVTISTPDATPTTSTVDGDAVADVIASILGMSKTKPVVEPSHEQSDTHPISPTQSMEDPRETNNPAYLSALTSSASAGDITHTEDTIPQTQTNPSKPHTSITATAPTTDIEKSQTTSDGSFLSEGHETFETTALSAAPSDKYHGSTSRAAEATAIAGGDSQMATQSEATPSPDVSTEDSDTNVPSPSSTNSGNPHTDDRASTLPGSATPPIPSASSSVLTMQNDMPTDSTSGTSATVSSSAPIQSDLSPRSERRVNITVVLLLAFFTASVWATL